jgi:formylglycine-generating enzyme required for sulfatase activity
MGTYGYIAPEQAEDARQADARSDVYGLGCTLYFLLLGRTMYSGDSSEVIEAHRVAEIPSLRAACPEAPQGLDEVFQRLVAKRPEERYASMAEVIEALQPLRDVAREVDGSSVVQQLAAADPEARDAYPQRDRSGQRDTTNSLASFKQSTHGGDRRQQDSTRDVAARTARGAALARWGLPGAAAVLLVVVAALSLQHLLPLLAGAAANNGENDAAPAPQLGPGDGELPVVVMREYTRPTALRYQEATARHLGIKRELTNSLGMQFALVPAHRLPPAADENGAAEVTRPVYFGIHEVTQDDYKSVMGVNPSAFVRGGAWEDRLIGVTDTARFPVDKMTLDEAREFCRLLSKLPLENKAQRTYRLPTAIEWHIACRAGQENRIPEDQLREYAWYDVTSKGRPHAVGQLKPNAFGLYDMLGNVGERVSYEVYGEHWVAGSKFSTGARFQTADQGHWIKGPLRVDDVGFRVVCETAELRLLELSEPAALLPEQPWDDELK